MKITKNPIRSKEVKLQPKFRFPEFNVQGVHRYNKFTFDKLFTFSTGKNIKQKEASPEFETPCVRYGELYHMYNEVINEVFNKTMECIIKL